MADLRVREATLWSGPLWVMGILVWAVRPFGEGVSAGQALPEGRLANGLILAAAPVVMLLVAYWNALRRPVEPYGLAAGRRIGGPVLIVLIVLSALLPTVGLARDDGWTGIATLVAVTASWWVMIEGQRRLRHPIGADDWTDSVLDTTRVHVEVVALGLLWLVVACVWVGARGGGEEAGALLPGLLWLTLGSAYAGVLVYGLPGQQVARWGSVAYGVVSLPVWATQSAMVQTLYLGAGSVAAALVLEQARRRARAARRERLVSAGLRANLLVRYGSSGMNEAGDRRQDPEQSPGRTC